MKINLSSIDRVKNFVDEISKVHAEVLLLNGNITVDPKSIMGIFALNLCAPIDFIVRGGDVESALSVARKYMA